jgi:multimeric flavodoxin WrbA
METKCFVLDGLGNCVGKDRLREVFREEAGRKGWTLDWADLGSQTIAPCRGCFGCWTRTPGMCLIQDDARELAGRLIRSDVTVWLTPVVHGGYASALKIALDRTALMTLLPFFSVKNGRTRHDLRYGRNPDILALGWLRNGDPEQERLFKAVVARNGANMQPERYEACVVHEDAGEKQWQKRVQRLLSFEKEKENHGANIVFFNGSPKRTGSATETVWSYLQEKIKKQGATVCSHNILGAQEKEDCMERLLEHLESADGVVLGFPLYADQVPGHVMAFMETIAVWCKEMPALKTKRLLAIANSGFPEPVNNDASMEICRLFARDAGFDWIGGCAIGGGGMLGGKPLEKFGLLTRNLRKTLDAKALLLVGDGGEQTLVAQSAMVPSALPAWLYRKIGDAGWSKGVKEHGRPIDFYARPYAAVGGES